MIGGRRPLLRKNLADTNPPRYKTPIFNLFSFVKPQQKVQLSLIGSPLRAFQ